MNYKTPVVLAIDLGTTSVKTALYDSSGKMIKLSQREQKLSFPNPGWVEQSLFDTYKLLIECVREITPGIKVDAIVLSVQRGSTVPISSDGNPLTNLMVWMDERGKPYVEMIEAEITPSYYYQIAAQPIVTITGVSKILWLYHQAKEIYDQVEVIGNQQTIFLKWLGCEDWVIDESVGSFFFPFVIEKKEWSKELAQRLNIPIEKLPRLVKANEVVGYLSKSAAEDLGLTAGIPLIPGGGDGQCAGVGCGATESGIAMVNIGTSTGVQVFLQKPFYDPSEVYNCLAHVIPDAWDLEGNTQASGLAFKWFRDEFSSRNKNGEMDGSYDELVADANRISPGSEGLIFLPTFYGSTAPLIDNSARGGLLGLSKHHTRAHVTRAILEGISLEIRWLLDTIEGLGVSINEVRLVGGGASNPLWNQMHCDIFNRKVNTIKTSEASLTGAAMCGFTALYQWEDFNQATEKFVKISQTYQPNPLHQNAYNKAYEHYKRLFVTLSKENLFRRV